MRRPDRISYDPTQPDLEGLRADPGKHLAHFPPGSTTTIEDLASAAIASSIQTDQDLTLEDTPMSIGHAETPRIAGSRQAELDVDAERRAYLEAGLDSSVPHPQEARILGQVSKKRAEIAQLQAGLASLQSELLAERTARGVNPLKSELETNLEQQVAYEKKAIEKAEGEIAKLQAKLEEVNDPFQRAKMQQELKRLEGDTPKLPEVILAELGLAPNSGTKAIAAGLVKWLANPLTSPRIAADMVAAIKVARADRGLTKKQQRAVDRALVRLGKPPAYGTGTEKRTDWIPGRSKSKKDQAKSQETSYSQVAKIGNVLEISGDFYAVQGIAGEQAVHLMPDGTKGGLFYDEACTRPVIMDSSFELALANPGTAQVYSSSGQKLDLSKDETRKAIHKGEEWISMQRLFTPEEAEQALLDGASRNDLAMQCIRLDDLVIGIGGDPSRRAKVLKEAERLKKLQESLVWQNLSDTASVPIAHPEASVPVFEDQNGHFVRPFTYAEQRRMEYLQSILESRTTASIIHRRGDIRPSKGFDDTSSSRTRGPRRRRRWWES